MGIRSPSTTVFFSRSSMESTPSFLGDFVHDDFHGESGLGLAGGAVGLDLLLVDHYVIAVHQEVVHLVGTQPSQGAASHGRAGESARLEVQVQLSGGYLAGLGDAYLAAHTGSGGGPGTLEDLRAAHDHLDGLAALPRQNHSHRVQVGH